MRAASDLLLLGLLLKFEYEHVLGSVRLSRHFELRGMQ